MNNIIYMALAVVAGVAVGRYMYPLVPVPQYITAQEMAIFQKVAVATLATNYVVNNHNYMAIGTPVTNFVLV